MSGKPGVTFVPESECLPLQVTLHFNVLFSIMYTILMGATCMSKVLYYNKKVAISSITVWVFFEAVHACIMA